MLKIGIELVGFSEWKDYLLSMPESLEGKLEDKVRMLTNRLYDKVIRNVTGDIINVKSGALVQSIRQQVRVDLSRGVVYGAVFASPQDIKATVLELGGDNWYEIVPINKDWLRFFWEKMGYTRFTKFVWHPPMKAREYLLSALEDMEDEINQTFEDFVTEFARGTGD